MAEETQQRQAPQKKSFYKEWIEPFLIAAVVALFIRQFVVEAFKIPSGSMIPTLTIGDHLLVNKFLYGPRIPFTDTRFFTWQEPKRGDIIVFKYPENEDKNFIKRIVGVPGDKIEIRKGVLLINDRPVPVTEVTGVSEPDSVAGMFGGRPRIYDEELGTVHHRIQYLLDQQDKHYGPITVPSDEVFVMGDNRDNSQDSRVWGFVRRNKILGKALIIYWSWDGSDGRWLRWERIGSLIK
jgi:signal peptidase I